MKYLFVIIVIMTSSLYGCLWLSGTTLDGEYREFNTEQSSFWFSRNLELNKEKIISKRLLSIAHETKSDKAVEYISKGDNQKAIDILLHSSNDEVDMYTKASNLAVAYELKGDILSAEKWMEQALLVNKKSHYGTEWLHLFILKSTYHLKKNPKWLDNKRLIPLPNKFNEATKIQIDSGEYNISEVRKALIYQLRERVIFVKPKDKIVSELFYTLGRIEAQTRVVEEAIKIFHFSKLYGFSDTKLMESRIEEYSKAFIYFYIRYGLILGIGIFLLLYVQKYFKSKTLKNSESKITISIFRSVAIIVSVLLLFTIFGTIVNLLILGHFGMLSENISPVYGIILGYFLGLFLIPIYMKQKNYVTNSKLATIVYAGIFVVIFYIYILVTFFEFNLMGIVPLPFMIFGLYTILKRSLPINRKIGHGK